MPDVATVEYRLSTEIALKTFVSTVRTKVGCHKGYGLEKLAGELDIRFDLA